MRVEKTIQAWMNLPWNEMESMQGESSMNETTLDEPEMEWNMQGEKQAWTMRKNHTANGFENMHMNEIQCSKGNEYQRWVFHSKQAHHSHIAKQGSTPHSVLCTRKSISAKHSYLQYTC